MHHEQSQLAPRQRRLWLFIALIGILVGTVSVILFFFLKEDKPSINITQDQELYVSAKDFGGTANCYVVSSSGEYKIKLVKGNSNISVGKVAIAEVLWESFGTDEEPNKGDLINPDVRVVGDYIEYRTADVFREGNAAIAAKDANGKILWSWHIWLTDQPQGQEYYNNAGTMMDRNLGATSATPGDVGALGLLYQWGRKDPFLGSSSISDDIAAMSTITWPSAVESNSSTGTIAYATANPTTFITRNDKNLDWHYTGSAEIDNTRWTTSDKSSSGASNIADSITVINELYGLVIDNTRWTTSDKTKSIYDPCPDGWRVPDGGDNGVWSKALGSGSDFKQEYNSSNKGMNFSDVFGSASTIWYPASGYRYDEDGGLVNVDGYGYYWSASPNIGFSAYLLTFGNYGNVHPSNSYNRARGRSVRCLQE